MCDCLLWRSAPHNYPIMPSYRKKKRSTKRSYKSRKAPRRASSSRRMSTASAGRVFFPGRGGYLPSMTATLKPNQSGWVEPSMRSDASRAFARGAVGTLGSMSARDVYGTGKRFLRDTGYANLERDDHEQSWFGNLAGDIYHSGYPSAATVRSGFGSLGSLTGSALGSYGPGLLLGGAALGAKALYDSYPAMGIDEELDLMTWAPRKKKVVYGRDYDIGRFDPFGDLYGLYQDYLAPYIDRYPARVVPPLTPNPAHQWDPVYGYPPGYSQEHHSYYGPENPHDPLTGHWEDNTGTFGGRVWVSNPPADAAPPAAGSIPESGHHYIFPGTDQPRP